MDAPSAPVTAPDNSVDVFATVRALTDAMHADDPIRFESAMQTALEALSTTLGVRRACVLLVERYDDGLVISDFFSGAPPGAPGLPVALMGQPLDIVPEWADAVRRAACACVTLEHDRPSDVLHGLLTRAQFTWVRTLPIHKDGRPLGALSLFGTGAMIEMNPSLSGVVELVTELVAGVVDHRQRIEDLAMAGRRVQDMLGRSEVVVFEIDQSGRCTYLSDSWVRLTGRPVEDQLGRRFDEEIIHPDDRGLYSRLAWAKAAARTDRWRFDQRIICADGRIVRVHTSMAPIVDEHGVRVGASGTLVEIDDAVQSASDLHLTVERVQTALDAVGSGVLWIDPTGQVQIVNAAAERILGVAAHDLLNRRLRPEQWSPRSVRGDPIDAPSSRWSQMLRTVDVFGPMTVRLRNLHGQEIHVRCTVQAVFSRGDRRRIGVVCILDEVAAGAGGHGPQGSEWSAEHLERALGQIRTAIGALEDAVESARSTGRPRRNEVLEGLSTREREVAELLLEGFRVPTIASRLYVSQHTVRNHLKSVFRKVGVASQAELVERLRGSDRE